MSRDPRQKTADSKASDLRAAPSRTEIDLLRQRISDLIRQKPEKAATILTGWVYGTPTPAKKNFKKAG